MSLKQRLTGELDRIRQDSLFKEERIITSPQGAHIKVTPGREVLNFCANNYLGLANHPSIIAAAHKALDDHGFGLASVRFICGTQDIHAELESRLSAFLGTEATILYSSCFDANGGLFETLLDEQDAVISDALNHASIIDGIRLCKAKRLRYRHADMEDLRAQLFAAVSREELVACVDKIGEWVIGKRSDLFHGIVRRHGCCASWGLSSKWTENRGKGANPQSNRKSSLRRVQPGKCSLFSSSRRIPTWAAIALTARGIGFCDRDSH